MPKYWVVQFAAIMFASMSMATAFCHLLEMYPKMRFEPELWVDLHNRLYPQFGFTGGVAEGVGLLLVGALTWLFRAESGLRAPLLIAFAAILLASLAWAAVIVPAAKTIGSWPLDAIPSDWTRWRNRWEYTHAMRAILMLVSLGSMVVFLLRQAARS